MMTIDLQLKCNQTPINIQIFIDKNFPRRSQPKIICLDSFSSNIIDSQTREIYYD